MLTFNGKCHICWNITEIAFCSVCNHWFCSNCRNKWPIRTFKAIQQMLMPLDNCCGPIDKGV